MGEPTWTRDGVLDEEAFKTDLGTYYLVRTYMDVSQVWLNNEKIFSSSTGSHAKSRDFVEKHYADAVANLNIHE